MRAQNSTPLPAVLAKVQADLADMAQSSEAEVASTANTFKSLAAQADTILKRAAAIVACVENENMSGVLSTVQSLCLTVSGLMEQKLDAARSVLLTLKQEEALLNQLAQVTHRQSAISSHLEALSVLTNVEVAQLGSVGADFLILAKELSVFSKSISQQTRELSGNAENRTQSVGESGQKLAATVPRLRGELNEMEIGIGENLTVIGAGLQELARIPRTVPGLRTGDVGANRRRRRSHSGP